MSNEHTETSHAQENEYPKLVRDNIPAIIEAKEGREVATRILNDDEFVQYLLKKAAEEAGELSRAETNSNMQEEIADVFEVIEALIKARGLSLNEIKSIQSQKRAKRGGFEQRLLMLNND